VLIADGGNSFHMWRVAANISNKQSRTADKEWSCSLEFRRGAATPHRKKTTCYEMLDRQGIS